MSPEAQFFAALAIIAVLIAAELVTIAVFRVRKPPMPPDFIRFKAGE